MALVDDLVTERLSERLDEMTQQWFYGDSAAVDKDVFKRTYEGLYGAGGQGGGPAQTLYANITGNLGMVPQATTVSTGMNTALSPGAARVGGTMAGTQGFEPITQLGGQQAPGFEQFLQQVQTALGRVTQNPLTQEETALLQDRFNRGNADPIALAYQIWAAYRNRPVEQGGELQPGQQPDPRAVWAAINGTAAAGGGGGGTGGGGGGGDGGGQKPGIAGGYGIPGGTAVGQQFFKTRWGLMSLKDIYDALLKENPNIFEGMNPAQITNDIILAKYGQMTGQAVVPATQAEIDEAYNTTAQKALDWQKRMDVTNLAANPRNLVQTLSMLGNTPEQINAFLTSQPYIRQLIGGGGYVQPSETGLGAGLTQATGTGGASATATNPRFSFIEGHQLPDPRQMLQDIETQNPRVDLISGLASYGGKEPGQFYGNFAQSLPRGSRNPLTSYY